MPWYSPGSTLTIQNSQDKMPTGLSIRQSISSSYHSDSPSYPTYRRTINYFDSSYSSRSPPTSSYRSNSISDEPLSSSSSRDRSETRESSAYSLTLNRPSRDLSRSRSTSKSSDSVLKSSPVLSSSTRKYSGTAPIYSKSYYDELRHYSPAMYITGSTRSSYLNKFEGRPPRSYTTNSRIQPTSISSSPTWEKSSLTSPSLLSSKSHQEVTDANQNNLLDLSIEDSKSDRASVTETYHKFNDFQHSGENECKTDSIQEVSTSNGDSENIGTTDNVVADNIKVMVVEEGEANGKSQERECMANDMTTGTLQEKTDLQNTDAVVSSGVEMTSPT